MAMPDGRTVLIVEDDHQWQAILRETLEDEGYGVTAIGDYHNGRQALKQACFDLVILDLELDRSSPMFEGRRLLDLISRHYSDTPCIIVSGKGDTQMVRDAFKRYQVVDYIIKDHFDIPTFIHAVQSALTPGASPVTLRQLLNGSDLFDPNDEGAQAIPEYERIS